MKGGDTEGKPLVFKTVGGGHAGVSDAINSSKNCVFHPQSKKGSKETQ